MTLRRFALIPLLIGLTACGSAAPKPSSAPPAAAPGPVQARAAASPAGAAQAQPAQSAPGAPAGAPNQQGLQGASPLQPLPPVNRMVIKNASLGISVDDPENSLSQVDVLVKSEQATIVSQNIRAQDDKTFVNLTIQVPPDNFEDTLAKLRDLRAHGTRVLADTVNAQDVTEQYVDLDAQYHNLQATRDAYQKLLDKATAVSDIITLTREVANLQTQLDQITGRQNLLSRQSGISTINLSLSPVGATPSPGPRPLPRPVQAAQQAWQALLTGLQGVAVVLIWMGILLPAPLLLLGLGWLAYRRAARPRPAYQADVTTS
ncbi:MAG TPA: DUF4349 domain-containing protein [Chloroflexota bacterium]